jgi:hypothetical protein
VRSELGSSESECVSDLLHSHQKLLSRLVKATRLRRKS